jgi:site-specific recombinase XerD
MAIILRKGSYYVDYYPDGRRGKRIRLRLPPGVDTEEQARAWERTIRGQKEEKGLVASEPCGSTINDLWPQYVAYARVNRLPSTAADIETVGKHFGQHLGNIEVVTISTAYIDLYKAARKAEGVKNRTINKELSWFSGFRRWCKNSLYPDLKPLAIERLSASRPVPLVLSIGEVVKLLSKAGPRQKAYFGLLYFVGLRRQEVNQAEWDDLDREAGVIRVTGKGNRQRIEPVPAIVLEWLHAIAPARMEGFIFLNRQTGKPVKRMNKSLTTLAKKAGITKRVYPHLLRHSNATPHLEEETDIRTVQELLGHLDIEQTQWYAQVTMKKKRQASKRLAEAYEREAVDNGGQREKDDPSKKP